MIIRMKSGEVMKRDALSLLDYLGVKKDVEGIHKVSGEVELITPAPFELATDEETGQGFAWTLSTFDLDRYGERIDPSGWDFARYRDNPVVEWAHRYDIPAIGKIENLSADNEGLHGIVLFNDKSFDAFGWGIGQRVKAGVIKAGAVGFRVIEIEIPDRETAQDGTSLIFRKQELLEFSICNVPANPFALTKSIETGKKEERQELGRSAYWGGLFNTILE